MSAKDIPGKNNFIPKLPFMEKPEELFVGMDSDVLFNGQPAGLVLAETHALANLAAKKVRITYIETGMMDASEISFAYQISFAHRLSFCTVFVRIRI